MNASANIPPPARSWRDIHQDIAPRAMSGEGRKRLAFATLKTIGLISIGCASLWGGYELFRLWKDDPVKLHAPVKSTPMRELVLQSDGSIDHDWVMRTLELTHEVDLMALDLYALRERLLAHPQVRTAVVARRLPDKLLVVLEERMPVARVRVQMSSGEMADLLVARDGVVYAGINLAEEVASSLPYLDGITLRRAEQGFAPVEGMETVSDLLLAARANTFDLYSGWRSVSLSRLRSDGVLIVRSSEVPEITFGTRDDFYKQLAQLDLIVDRTRQRADGLTLASVNLAVGHSANGVLVPVVYADPPVAGAAPSAPGRGTLGPSNRSQANRPSALFQPQRPSLF